MRSVAAQTWLILRNDLRLLWRDLGTGKWKTFLKNGVLTGGLFVGLNALGILLFVATDFRPSLAEETVMWFFFALVMLGAAMNHAISVLFEREDFDLLLSAPVSSRAILLARLAAMTVGAALSPAMFLPALINGAAIAISPQYAWSYPVWLLLACAVASAGVWATLVLVKLLGPRRARVWAQIVAAILGAIIYFFYQGQSFLPRAARDRFFNALLRTLDHPVFSFIARAGRGEWPSLLALTGITAGFALLTTRLLGRRFITGIQEGGAIQPKTRRTSRYRFVGGLGRATFRKDLRLILRDPLLWSKILPSVFYLAPIVLIMNRTSAGVAELLAPFNVAATIILSSRLTSVAVTGEVGRDLIRMSPASPVRLRIAKLAAGLAAPAGIGAVVAIVVALLGRPGLALIALGTALTAAGATCWMQVGSIRPTPRADVIGTGRRSQGGCLQIIAGLVLLIGGIAGVSQAAHDRRAFAIVTLGVVALVALMCFTLIEIKDVEA